MTNRLWALFIRFVHLIRAQEWWEFKIPVALGTLYSLAWVIHVSVISLSREILLVVLAGISSGVYASVVNDITDLQDDKAAGKATVIMSLPRKLQLSILFVSLLLEFAVGLAFLPFHHAFTLFAAIFVNFTIYSCPPIRLKKRGLWGVLSIAAGENLMPVLLAAYLVADATHRAIPTVWLVFIVTWSLALGCRGILWHQLKDSANDRTAGTVTAAHKYGDPMIRKLGEFVVFPIEASALIVLLAFCGNRLAFQLLGGALILDWLRYRFMGMNVIIVAPKPRFRMALLDYYQLFFPLAFLIGDAERNSAAWWLVVFQLILFPMQSWVCISHLAHLIRWRLWPFLTARIYVVPGA